MSHVRLSIAGHGTLTARRVAVDLSLLGAHLLPFCYDLFMPSQPHVPSPLFLDSAALALADTLAVIGLSEEALLDVPPTRNDQFFARAAVSSVYRSFNPNLPQSSNASRFRPEFLFALTPPMTSLNDRYRQLSEICRKTINHPRTPPWLGKVLSAFKPERDSLVSAIGGFISQEWDPNHSRSQRTPDADPSFDIG